MNLYRITIELLIKVPDAGGKISYFKNVLFIEVFLLYSTLIIY